MKKRILICSFLSSGILSMSAYADDFTVLNINYNNAEQSFTLSSLQKLTFTNGKMVATLSSGTEEIALPTLSKMYFASKPTEVLPLISTSGTTIAYNAEKQSLTIASNNSSVARIYQMNGNKIIEAPFVSGNNTIDLSSLPKGVFIVKANAITYKFMK